ncbi:MAG: sensor histidine kinase [Chloroflexota bacterium]
MLAVIALLISAVALIFVLDDPEAPGSLREQAGEILTRLGGEANMATGLAVAAGLALAVVLALSLRSRDAAAARAACLSRQLDAAGSQVEHFKSALAARDRALLTVIHELRTPLTHVVGYAELLSGGARPRHPQEVGEMSAAIQSASSTMLRLMDDLTEATRLHAEGFSLKTRPVDLGNLIQGIVVAFEAQRQAHHLTVVLPEHWLAAHADPERIRQVLTNLLTNAITYSPSGGTIQIRARLLGQTVRVEIEDQGIGLVPEDQARIFDRFYRASAGRALRAQGSGLGLSIVKDLVEAHGGQVGVTSHPGEGSTFWFTLPAADERQVSSQPHQAVPRSARPAHVSS